MYLATKNRIVGLLVLPLFSLGGISLARGIQAHYSVSSCFGGFDCSEWSLIALKMGLSLVLIGIGIIAVNHIRTGNDTPKLRQ